MRTVSIPVYTSKKLELFVERVKDGFELWAVGIVKGQRILIDHHLTRDDLETRLEYARPEDLIWRDAERSEIPAEKHTMAIQMEETIYERRGFWDGVTSNLAAIRVLVTDRKEANAAKKAMLGRWTDGVVTLSLEPDHRLQWTCTHSRHWLNVWGQDGKQSPDWWNMSSWELGFLAGKNTPKACGTHSGVVHVDEKEFHIRGGHINRIVHVFQKVQAA
jgi:hypothetical protein